MSVPGGDTESAGKKGLLCDPLEILPGTPSEADVNVARNNARPK